MHRLCIERLSQSQCNSPSSSEVTSSCHAFFGSFVLRDCTLLLKLSMALCARETVEFDPDPIEAPPLPTPPPPPPPWARPSGGAVGGFESGLRTLPLL